MTKAALADHAFIALGANLPGDAGNPAETLFAVLPHLQLLSDHTIVVSPFFESDPKDCPPGSPVYINAVVALVPHKGETPEFLLAQLQKLEKHFGRTRAGIVNEARPLDLDLLAYPAAKRHTPQLVLPHPRAHERRFVLEPWIALAGSDWQLSGKTLEDWLALCSDPPLRIIQDKKNPA